MQNEISDGINLDKGWLIPANGEWDEKRGRYKGK